MMKFAVENALKKLNELQQEHSRYDEKSWKAYQDGNEKKSDYYDKKADAIAYQIDGFTKCLKALGFGVWWCDDYNEYLIPDDDITKLCD